MSDTKSQSENTQAKSQANAEVTCPKCKGIGAALPVLIKPENAESRLKIADKIINNIDIFACHMCDGKKTVDIERLVRYIKSQWLKKDRIIRNKGLSKEAERLGIKPSELSDYEHGRKDPDQLVS